MKILELNFCHGFLFASCANGETEEGALARGIGRDLTCSPSCHKLRPSAFPRLNIDPSADSFTSFRDGAILCERRYDCRYQRGDRQRWIGKLARAFECSGFEVGILSFGRSTCGLLILGLLIVGAFDPLPPRRWKLSRRHRCKLNSPQRYPTFLRRILAPPLPLLPSVYCDNDSPMTQKRGTERIDEIRVGIPSRSIQLEGN